MRTSTIIARYRSSIDKVWRIVTDNSNTGWRSDLSDVRVSEDGKTFVETTKGGYRTTFTVMLKEPFARYEFDMKNRNFSGHWVGVFTSTENGGTEIEFTEELNIKNPVIEILSYIGMPLKKMQKRYAEDLRKALGEEEQP